jgi:small GTP-binding protein
MTSDSDNDNDHLDDTETKVIIVGKSSVGKTSLVNYMNTGSTLRSAQPTVGANFTTKTYQYQNRMILIQMWDTAGHERFRAMTPLYFRGAKIALIAYAVNDAASFLEVDGWKKSIEDTLGDPIPIILIANKIDQPRTLATKDGTTKAAEMGARYVETSAITGEGINELLDQISEIVVAGLRPLGLENISLTAPPEQKNGGCC